MNAPIRWGIIGCGKIARLFASDLLLVESADLVAVASRSMDRAKMFAQDFGVPTSYSDYTVLARHPEVDVIYVATPHTFHKEHTLLALSHGKHVLCEKPFAMSMWEVEEMQSAADSGGLLLMEAMWTRFLPATRYVLDTINAGSIGEITHLKADLGFLANPDPSHRLYNKALGGGSLMDIGIYPVYLSLLLLGLPTEIKAMARFSATGVDTQCCVICRYDSGALASLESTFLAATPSEAFIYGTKGMIKMHTRFHEADTVSVTNQEGHVHVEHLPATGRGYCHEIIAMGRYLLSGPPYRPAMAAQDSRDLMYLLDAIRSQVGLEY